MSYVDGYLTPVPVAHRARFKAVSNLAATVFKEYGAISYVECWSDDVPDGSTLSMRTAVQLQENEEVVFTVITWPSKETRNSGHKKVMNDPRMQPGVLEMPFDVDRMIMGGFVPITGT